MYRSDYTLFPLSVEAIRSSSFSGWDEQTVEFVEQMNQDNRDIDDPFRYLHGLSQRQNLNESTHQRNAYQAGLVMGAILIASTIRIKSHGSAHQGDYYVPHDGSPSTPEHIDRFELFKKCAAGHRFLLGQFFNSREDIKIVIEHTIEQPWHENGMSFIEPDLSSQGKNNWLVVGFGDVFGLYAALHNEEFSKREPLKPE